MKAGRWIVAMAMATVLSGCAGGLVSKTPPDTYGLSAAPAIAGQKIRNRQILITEPTALKALLVADEDGRPLAGAKAVSQGGQDSDH